MARPEHAEARTEEVAVKTEDVAAKVVREARVEAPDMNQTPQRVAATAIIGMVLLPGTVSSR